MKRSKQLARDRLDSDIHAAITRVAANVAYRTADAAQAKQRLDVIMDWRSNLCEMLLDTFDRNWTFTERARGERTAT